MADLTLEGNPIHSIGNLPEIGTTILDFSLTNNELKDISLNDFAGKKKILNIFPSLDTPVCSMSVSKFNNEAAQLNNTVILHISADLPFAHGRFCSSMNIEHSITLSTFRSSFTKDYQVEIVDGPIKGLCSRAIIVVDENNKVLHTEQVEEITKEVDYDKALAAIK